MKLARAPGLGTDDFPISIIIVTGTLVLPLFPLPCSIASVYLLFSISDRYYTLILLLLFTGRAVHVVSDFSFGPSIKIGYPEMKMPAFDPARIAALRGFRFGAIPRGVFTGRPLLAWPLGAR